MRLHPQNPTPGVGLEHLNPATVQEAVEIIDIILDGLGSNKSFHLMAAKKRLEDLKKRLPK